MSVTKVILPKLGLTMDEGRVIAWHKKEGDRIAKGEILFEVETDKANMEIESPASGYVRRILLPVDASAPVATVIGLISDTADEPLPSLSEVVPSAAQATPSVAAATPSVAAMTPPSDGERVRSSPAARKRAQELGVDIASVRGTGPGGRINIEDVEAAAGGPAAARAAPGGNGVPEKREPLSRMRRAVAEAMTRSVREAPQFSISRDVDMSNADRRRKAAGASYTDVIVSAAAKALRAHPRLRSRLDGDALVTTERIDVGIAIALDAGLIVPVVRDAETKGLAALKDERERLEAAVRSGHAPGDAFGGAAITVSNLGTLGVDRFTAIVNPPEAAILAVGRVADRVTVVGGAPTVRPIASLTLSVDHRVADGADAARYLADVVKELEAS
ncbi:MAG: 2-oxo acid dehydrogenase subunit E2 [Chloroflexi bacterium]|nr:MAG: 2-oxo acid dehydrogenase subunit E2 [Chloroflexota bacterium]TMC57045.1 MAG: 2-oxo acid dehydrogenase subunit E2 [Chloroflexota bacterium]